MYAFLIGAPDYYPQIQGIVYDIKFKNENIYASLRLRLGSFYGRYLKENYYRAFFSVNFVELKKEKIIQENRASRMCISKWLLESIHIDADDYYDEDCKEEENNE